MAIQWLKLNYKPLIYSAPYIIIGQHPLCGHHVTTTNNEECIIAMMTRKGVDMTFFMVENVEMLLISCISFPELQFYIPNTKSVINIIYQ
ncbi:hypothetical protein QTP88_008780 [Uroleucon formosanum]